MSFTGNERASPSEASFLNRGPASLDASKPNCRSARILVARGVTNVSRATAPQKRVRDVDFSASKCRWYIPLAAASEVCAKRPLSTE